MNFTKLQILLSLLLITCTISCEKNESSLADLDDTFFVRHQQADMPVYVHGNATDKVFLIYLHGGPGGLGLEARVNTMITEVEKNNAVVYFDQRGSGNAQGNYSEDDVSIDIMVQDVLALVEVLRVKYGEESRFFLMGASWGGTLGTATLLASQDDFLGWIDVDGVHNPQGLYGAYPGRLREKANEQIALGNSVEHWEDVLELAQEVGSNYSDEDFYKLNIKSHNSEEVLAHDSIINQPHYRDENGEDISFTIRNNQQTIIILTQKGLWRDVTYTDRLSEITIPALVLWGKHDLVVPTRFAYEAFDNLGSDQKELVLFERSGHSPLESEPARFAEKVIAFINSHR